MSLCLKVDVPEITLLPIGITAKYDGNVSGIKEFLISLAGPLASFLFFVILENKVYSIFNLIICLTNLMPILPFDGGRIIKLFIKRKNRLLANVCITKIFILVMVCFAIFQIVFYDNFYFAIFTSYVCVIANEEIKKEKMYRSIDYLQTYQETVN